MKSMLIIRFYLFLMTLIFGVHFALANVSCNEFLGAQPDSELSVILVYDSEAHRRLAEFFGADNTFYLFHSVPDQSVFSRLNYKEGNLVGSETTSIPEMNYFSLQLMTNLHGVSYLGINTSVHNYRNTAILGINTASPQSSENVSIFIDTNTFRFTYKDEVMDSVTGEVKYDLYIYEFVKNSDGSINFKFDFIVINKQDSTVVDQIQEIQTHIFVQETDSEVISYVLDLFFQRPKWTFH